MTTGEKYVRARNPDRWRILGRELRDFTAAHAELLDQIGYDAGAIAPETLLTAVRICSLDRDRARAYARRGGRYFVDAVLLILFRMKPEIFREAAAAFQSYLDAANETPGYWADEKETRVSTCPPLLMMTRDLAHYWHISEADVLDMPLAEAEWRRLAILEAAGALEFKTEEDDRVLDDVRAMALEYAKAGRWE